MTKPTNKKWERIKAAPVTKPDSQTAKETAEIIAALSKKAWQKAQFHLHEKHWTYAKQEIEYIMEESRLKGRQETTREQLAKNPESGWKQAGQQACAKLDEKVDELHQQSETAQ